MLNNVVNKSFLKFLTDFGPLLIFFTVYYKSGNNLSLAIPPLIISTIIAVAIVYFIERKIPYVPLMGGVIISLFGGLTLYFNNPIFLYVKPTVINILFAVILLLAKIFFKRNLLKNNFPTNKVKAKIKLIIVGFIYKKIGLLKYKVRPPKSEIIIPPIRGM